MSHEFVRSNVLRVVGYTLDSTCTYTFSMVVEDPMFNKNGVTSSMLVYGFMHLVYEYSSVLNFYTNCETSA